VEVEVEAEAVAVAVAEAVSLSWTLNSKSSPILSLTSLRQERFFTIP
jgi:hypothetical protein